ncbi:hypothetical protein W03_18170 [Nitrosomonas sp. PY1]|uniref:hypothetical protein n=1 Tax=Nitrosomonas sp. PY1 TaxID=1803906 RepID=UPI001FC8E4AF|nr:hypothetical protein [Nitrosomonas sp. PY1]GKS69813.1 hypothetical protein W03_18170 [Nitrosomonas sp. PY1]
MPVAHKAMIAYFGSYARIINVPLCHGMSIGLHGLVGAFVMPFITDYQTTA